MQDDDNSAYIAYSSEENKVMHISQLSKDYVGVTQKFTRTMVSPLLLVSFWLPYHSVSGVC